MCVDIYIYIYMYIYMYIGNPHRAQICKFAFPVEQFEATVSQSAVRPLVRPQP